MNKTYNKPSIEVVRYDAPDNILTLSTIDNSGTAKDLTSLTTTTGMSISISNLNH